MTVSVSWPKGYVQPAHDMIGTAFFWKQHPGLKVMLVGLLLLVGYYYWAWRYMGVDPKSRGLAPFYSPPKGISPAMAAYIHTMGSANIRKCMSASMISLCFPIVVVNKVDRANSSINQLKEFFSIK